MKAEWQEVRLKNEATLGKEMRLKKFFLIDKGKSLKIGGKRVT